MNMGQNKRIAVIVVAIFAISLTSVLLVLGKDRLFPSGNDLKIDILGTIGHGSGHEEESYRDILANSEDPIFAIESDGTLSYLSPGLEAVLGYEPGELTGKIFFPLFHEKDLPAVMTDFTKLLQSGESLNSAGPFRLQVKNDDFRYVLISAVIFKNEKGKSARIVGTIKDITDSIEEFKKEKKSVPKGSGPKIRDTENPADDSENRLVVDKVS